uniref:Tc1-like transposase DDE domain-containing protein n=1 Tax=Plectus sambesii TaxID=2011161 RepID=A0A914X8P7_9BILA
MSKYREEIIKLFTEGRRQFEIVRELAPLKVSQRLVSKTIQRYRELGNSQNRPRSGRPRSASTARNVKIVRDRLRRNPQRSARKMAQEVGISDRSLRRILRNELKVKPYKKKKVAFLRADAKVNRVKKCKVFQTRLADDKHRSIVFSDEKIFRIEEALNSQNVRVWTADPFSVQRKLTRKQGAASIMVWGGITSDGRTPLHVFKKGTRITAKVYQQEILEGVLEPWAQQHFADRHWCLQQDSAPAHRAKSVQKWCRDRIPDFIAYEDWPSSSPDLNPMDFAVWGILTKDVSATYHKSAASLERKLRAAWAKIPQETLRAAVDVFPRRVKACIKAKGDNFEYPFGV